MSALEKELLRGADIQARKLVDKKQRLRKTKSKFQQKIEEIEEKALRLRSDLADKRVLMDIERRYLVRTQPAILGKLGCPRCGAGDVGNIVNGEPWCFKCNRRLVSIVKARVVRKKKR